MDVAQRAGEHLQTAVDGQPYATTQDAARFVLQLRKAAKSCFGESVMSEPALNLMLALYGSDSSLGDFHIGSIAECADVPRSTALRWLTKLQRSGFVTLRTDPRDKRAVHVLMTDAGREAIARAIATAEIALFDTSTSVDRRSAAA